jgi:hypothetical protein
MGCTEKIWPTRQMIMLTVHARQRLLRGLKLFCEFER